MTVDEFLHRYPIRLAGDCWRWAGSIFRNAYGRIQWRESGKVRHAFAHRLAWETFRGPIAAGHVLTCMCEEHGALCVNPAHWAEVDRATKNYLQAVHGRTSSGMRHSAVTTIGTRRSRRHKLSIDKAREIRLQHGNTSADDLAAKYGVSAETIRSVWRHDLWREASPWSV